MTRFPTVGCGFLASIFLVACGSSGPAVSGGTAGTTGTAGSGGSATSGAGGTGGTVAGGGGTGGSGGTDGNGGTGGTTAAQTCDGFTIPPDHRDATAYDTTAAGVAADAVTGLDWQRAAIDQDPSWTSAATHCAGLTLAGASGWRVPTALELSSIVDFAAANPAIDAVAFPGTPATYFVTSTGVYQNGMSVGGSNYWHVVDFKTGLTLNGMPTSGSVRCVRSATAPRCYPADGRFTATSSSGVDAVLDAATGLTWQKAPSTDKLAWADAAPYCTSLGVGFRMPGAKELLSLVDWKARAAAIDASAFPGTPAGAFWTSSRVAGSATDAVTVDFSASVYAGTSSAAASTPQYVRCVR